MEIIQKMTVMGFFNYIASKKMAENSVFDSSGKNPHFCNLQIQLLKWKQNIVKCCYSNSYLLFQNPVVLSTVPWEPKEILTLASENLKNDSRTSDTVD